MISIVPPAGRNDGPVIRAGSAVGRGGGGRGDGGERSIRPMGGRCTCMLRTGGAAASMHSARFAPVPVCAPVDRAGIEG